MGGLQEWKMEKTMKRAIWAWCFLFLLLAFGGAFWLSWDALVCKYSEREFARFPNSDNSKEIVVRTALAGTAAGVAYQVVRLREGSDDCGAIVARVYEDEVRAPIEVTWRSFTDIAVIVKKNATLDVMKERFDVDGVSVEIVRR